MKDFYLRIYKIDESSITVDTNLTQEMLKHKEEYEDSDYLLAVSIALNKINQLGDSAKEKYKQLCEENGMLLYNAARVVKGLRCNDLIEENIAKYISFCDTISDEIKQRKSKKSYS